MRQRISASTRQFLEKTKATELVGEAKEKRLLSSVSKYPRKLTWRQRTDRSELLSSFGLIEVWADDGFIVLRNDAPLFHPTCRAVSVFLTLIGTGGCRAALLVGVGRLRARAGLLGVRVGRRVVPGAGDHAPAGAVAGRRQVCSSWLGAARPQRAVGLPVWRGPERARVVRQTNPALGGATVVLARNLMGSRRGPVRRRDGSTWRRHTEN